MRFRYNALLFGLKPTFAYALQTKDFQNRCNDFSTEIKLDYTFEVNALEYLRPNATIDLNAEGLNATCATTGTTTPPVPIGLCRLNLRVATSNRSEIYMEVWLPEEWTGRTLTTGNGGLAGCMFWPSYTWDRIR